MSFPFLVITNKAALNHLWDSICVAYAFISLRQIYKNGMIIIYVCVFIARV